MNRHFRRYMKFVKTLKKMPDRVIAVKETHHIIPKTLGGSDKSYNLIDLDAREHLIAHLLLAKSFPENARVVSAFVQMCNKNYRKLDSKQLAKIANSRLYQAQKSAFYQNLKEERSGKLYALSEDGQKVYVTTSEYRRRPDLQFHTKGKVRVWNIAARAWEQINTEDYDDSIHQHWSHRTQYRYLNLDTGDVEFLTRDQAANMNVKAIVNHMLPVFDSSNNKVLIRKDEYNPEVHTHVLKGKLSAVNVKTGERESLTLEEYKSAPGLYETSTKGKVLARNRITGKQTLVTKEEFEQDRDLVGQTHGLRVMRDAHTNQIVQVTKTQIFAEPGRYVGLNSGKVNAYDIELNQFIQVEKDEYDRYKGVRYFNPISAKVKVAESKKMVLLAEYLRSPKSYTLLSQIRGDRKIIYEKLTK
jgi:hypothetical protein